MTGFGFGADRFGWTDDALALVERLRGWTEPAIESLALTWDGEHVGFPIVDEAGVELGELHYLPDPARRNGRRKTEQPAGVPRQLFPPPEALANDVERLLLVEGEPDAVTAIANGYSAVAVPGTAGWSPRYAARFSGRRWTVYVVFDCDAGGREAAHEVVRSLVEVGVDARIVELDASRDDGYDLTDYLRDHGRDSLEYEVLRTVEPYREPPSSGPAPWAAQPWPTFRDESPTEHRWIVDGLIPAGALAFVAGPPKKGKTWVGLALGIAIATGRPLLTYSTERRPVLYVALEGSRTGLRARIGALARGFDVDPDGSDLDDLHLLYRPRPFNLVELATAEWLRDAAERVDAGLVVVDVLRAAARFQENVAEDFARVRDALEPLLVDDRTALLLHHFGKLTETQKERSPGERMAGTGAMYGALDVGLLITSSSDHARRMRIEVEARDFAAPDALQLVIAGDGSGEHGGFTYTDRAMVDPDDSAEGEDVIVELLDLFADGQWRSGDELALALRRDRKSIEGAIVLDTSRRNELAESPRIVRWDRDGRDLGRAHNARPFGTRGMYESILVLGSGSPEHPEHDLSGSGRLLGPPYGGDRGTEHDREPGSAPPEQHEQATDERHLEAVPDDDEEG